MTWLDTLRTASFKGIEFKVEGHDAEVGRRLKVNEYVFRDEPFTEDLGRKARRWDVQAYLVSQFYTSERDAIMAAVEAGGVGTFVHPYLGEHRVICESLRVRETKEEGGYCALSFTFVEAGSRTYPNAEPIPVDQVTLGADSLINAVQAAFEEGMVLTGVSGWIREEYSAGLSAAADIFSVIQTNGGINKQSTVALINKAAEWSADVNDLLSPPLSFLSDAAKAAQAVISVFEGVNTLAPNNADALLNLNRFSSFEVDFTDGESAAAAVASTNAGLLQEFIRTVSLANEAKALSKTSFTSYEEAITGRESLLSRIETLAETTLNDDVFSRARQLRAEIAAAVPGENESLPRIMSFPTKKSLPSLVISYDLYGDVENDQDVIDRNATRNPIFMNGGADLSVLNYDTDSA